MEKVNKIPICDIVKENDTYIKIGCCTQNRRQLFSVSFGFTFFSSFFQISIVHLDQTIGTVDSAVIDNFASLFMISSRD